MLSIARADDFYRWLFIAKLNKSNHPVFMVFDSFYHRANRLMVAATITSAIPGCANFPFIGSLVKTPRTAAVSRRPEGPGT
jgi:hypothetical protein